MSEIEKASNSLALTGDYEADLEVGAKIRAVVESLQFALGDWVLGLEERYTDSVRTLATDMSRVTGVPANTLREYARVSRVFKADSRLSSASWSHHQAASYADEPEVTLDLAVKEGLSKRDTIRLAKGLPTGGEAEAIKTSSAANAGANLEETALLDIETARLHLQRALDTLRKPGFRLTQPVGADILSKLEAVSRPFVAIEDAVRAEVGAIT